MKVTISSDIRFKNEAVPWELMFKLKKDLTLTNPDYVKATRLGFSTHGKDEEIKLYKIMDEELVLPRGYGPRLHKHCTDLKIPIEYIDNRLELEPVDFGSNIKLRDYQMIPVDVLTKKRQGGLVSGCGSGKTVMMLEAMARLGQPTLWICNSYELLNQTLERALQVLSITQDDIGIIAGGKVNVGSKLTLALVQTLSRTDVSGIINKFGTVLVDEAHHLAAKSFYSSVGRFPARNRLWASATPERQDGLTQMVFVSGGPILCTINQSELPTVIPELTVVETDYTHFLEEYPAQISHLSKDIQRNHLIAETIAKEAPGHFSLVLSDRREHLERLKTLLSAIKPELKTEILVGTMSKKARIDVMERMKNKEIDVLLATQLAKEGLDIIHLDRLFLSTPKRAAATVQQEVGRIMRPASGKESAIVFDFWDNKHLLLKGQFWGRRNVYLKLGMDWSPRNNRRSG